MDPEKLTWAQACRPRYVQMSPGRPLKTQADPAHVLGRRLLFNFRNVRNGEGGGVRANPYAKQHYSGAGRGGHTAQTVTVMLAFAA